VSWSENGIEDPRTRKGVTLPLSGVSMGASWNSFKEEKPVFQGGGQPGNLLPNFHKSSLKIFLLITL
jgi:hypothetical protein